MFQYNFCSLQTLISVRENVLVCFLRSQTDSAEITVLPVPLTLSRANYCTAAFIHDSHKSLILKIWRVLYSEPHAMRRRGIIMLLFTVQSYNTRKYAGNSILFSDYENTFYRNRKWPIIYVIHARFLASNPILRCRLIYKLLSYIKSIAIHFS